MNMKEAAALALESGFSCAACLDVSSITLLDEVRDMCSANTCGQYGKNWACPPACGELAELRQQVGRYREGILVQTVGEVEDSMDFEAMMEIEAEHKSHFNTAARRLKEIFPGLLALGAGCCTICGQCTYPDQPCRFPGKRVSSMEAYGILVNDLCKKNHLAYYYGTDRIAYTSCYLLV